MMSDNTLTSDTLSIPVANEFENLLLRGRVSVLDLLDLSDSQEAIKDQNVQGIKLSNCAFYPLRCQF